MGPTVSMGVKIRLRNSRHAMRVPTESREIAREIEKGVNKVHRPETLIPARKRATRWTQHIIPKTRTAKKKTVPHKKTLFFPLASGR